MALAWTSDENEALGMKEGVVNRFDRAGCGFALLGGVEEERIS
ncbi:MAG TPA: hypothetical protein VEX68_19415 [Bryobacteraceae bacterium]|nr:hypothetical protein [Bryobacteraceae bacterium]